MEREVKGILQGKETNKAGLIEYKNGEAHLISKKKGKIVVDMKIKDISKAYEASIKTLN